MRRGVVILTLQGLVWCGTLVVAVACRDASSQVETEARRLGQELNAKPLADPGWKRARPDLEGSLARVRADARAGRLYLSLEELDETLTRMRALEASKEKPPALHDGISAFDSVAVKTRRELAVLERRAGETSRTGAPAAIQALAETARSTIAPLAAASRAYAGFTRPASGMYYLGQAKAAAEFAAFCASLDARRQAEPLPLRSISAELRRLGERTAAAYQPPRSLQLHPQFISLNATLKLAGELDAARLYAGAWYQYLDAAQQFGLLESAAPDAARRSALHAEVAALRARLASSRLDGSIAELFLQRAEAALALGNGAAPYEQGWERAAVIVARVLPAYFAALQPASSPAPAPAGVITVTLLRWPDT